jgi:hypothetical protein
MHDEEQSKTVPATAIPFNNGAAPLRHSRDLNEIDLISK